MSLRLILGLCLALCAPLPASAQDCVAPPYSAPSGSALDRLLSRALPVIAGYPSLQRALQAEGPTICLAADIGVAMGYYEPSTNTVMVDAALNADLQVVILAHEIRHVEQFGRGICPHDGLSMREYARATWAIEADAMTITLIVAWALREGGAPGPWQALADLPRYADMTSAFAAGMADHGDLFTASEAAFTLWYENESRRQDYYIASCSAYLDRLDATHALPRYETLRDDFFDQLCVLPDGTPFSCDEPALP
ncbi:hypothetical protein roselon_01261 [Roseibacterium elongatum DSM 19469]|uniref:DUF6782 domain-containing protein n=1 Tax=Roseicyclus elongatus DSM 19469 TaxID=1294273 RepID=W8S4D2_9RHOB|nr:DUF6782 family putative metallopeptidase [Roseibacterium elongatum]AHM03651.1 hypothetical protein roselon_01261 [Roseibacterium elongatum DSM 19469]